MIETTGSRVMWVDTAKGLAILGVAYFHAVFFFEAVSLDGGIRKTADLVGTLRMPLFFFASGLFASRLLTQGFGELWRRRLELFLYLYVLWSIVRWGYFQAVPWVVEGSDPSRVSELARIFVWPMGGLWFLYALAIFSLAVWATRRVGPVVQIGVAVLISAAFGAGIIEVGNDGWDKMGAHVAYFVAAVHLRRPVVAAAARTTPLSTAVLVGTYLAAAGVLVFVAGGGVPFVRLGVSALAIAAGISVSFLLVKHDALRWLGHLGRNTLPIYLVHYLPLAGFAALALHFDVTVNSPAIGFLLVVSATAASVAISLVVHRVLSPIPGLFGVPWRDRRPASDLATAR